MADVCRTVIGVRSGAVGERLLWLQVYSAAVRSVYRVQGGARRWLGRRPELDGRQLGTA